MLKAVTFLVLEVPSSVLDVSARKVAVTAVLVTEIFSPPKEIRLNLDLTVLVQL